MSLARIDELTREIAALEARLRPLVRERANLRRSVAKVGKPLSDAHRQALRKPRRPRRQAAPVQASQRSAQVLKPPTGGAPSPELSPGRLARLEATERESDEERAATCDSDVVRGARIVKGRRY